MANDHAVRIGIVLLALYGICCGMALGQQRREILPAQAAVPPDTAALLRTNGGSLLRATLTAQADPRQAKLSDVSFFSVPEPQPQSFKKHDLITIIVREQSEVSSQASTDQKRQNDMDAKLDSFIKLNLKNLHLTGDAISSPLEAKGNVDREFKGDGTLDRSDSFTGRITAAVLDVKPNGVLVLQARKSIKTDDEEQVFILTGDCRAADVMPDNTILSTQLYDLDLIKNNSGAMRDVTQRGWLTKLLDAVNPF
jgi:flagellar L-ring protein precursor FlgH